MSELDLDTIEARAEAATPGPWSAADHVVDFGPTEGPRVPFAVVHAHADHRTPQQAVNAMFIAHARTDVPALVAEVRRLRAALKRQARDGYYAAKPDPAEQPKTIGDIRRAIDGLPDDAQAFINISGHGEDYAIAEVWASEQIPAGEPWPTDKRTIGLEINLGLFPEHPPAGEEASHG